MTAEVIIMNKRGVAVAADSATTWQFGNRSPKIPTSTNKIEVISLNPPIALTHYSASFFNGLAWSVIVQSFKISHQIPWKSIAQCKDAFIKYLAKLPIVNFEDRTGYIVFRARQILAIIKKAHSDDEQIKQLLLSKLDEVKKAPLFKGMEKFPQGVNQKTLKNIDQVFNSFFKDYLKKDVKWGSIARELLLETLSHKCWYNYTRTGIAITGYGTDEFYPAEKRFNVYGIVGDKLAYEDIGETRISATVPAAVIPLAQTDEMETFFNGVSPELRAFFERQVPKDLRSLKDEIIEEILQHKAMKTNSKTISQFKLDIEKVINERFRDRTRELIIQFLKAESFNQSDLRDTLKSLALPDLAKFAQGLIDFTSFKRKFQQSDAGTVGGKTEVAVLSKTDGFVWAKHKEFINQEINQDFFGKVEW